jgi:signal transduction histidine kinase
MASNSEQSLALDDRYVERRAEEIFTQQLFHIHSHTDRLFAVLFVLQWLFAIGCALILTPRTWVGAENYVHAHVWISIFFGGLLSAAPIVAALMNPGAVSTRNLIAITQVLYSALLIHLTGGRIETHFHVFGSLAIMAFYRDCRIFIPATIVVFVDHLARGIFWPESVFGVLTAAPWRAFEHAGWVLFEVLFLTWGCITASRDLRTVALTQAQLEQANRTVEVKVLNRTDELYRRSCELEDEMKRRQKLESQLLQAQKSESIGELAAGIAHEINTPMQFISDNIEYLSECCEKLFEVVDAYEHNLHGSDVQRSWQERRQELAEITERNRFDTIRQQVPTAISESLEGVNRVIGIVRAMKEFSHQGREAKLGVDLNNAVRSTIMISRNRWKYVADLETDLDPDLPTLHCVSAEINQVLLNLIVNAADAVADKASDDGDNKGRIIVRTRGVDDCIIVEVADTGCGIPPEIRSRIFDPFFTTKDVGKGTGQGLAICYNIIVNKQHGAIEVDSEPGLGTTFRVKLPITSNAPQASSIEAVAEPNCEFATS